MDGKPSFPTHDARMVFENPLIGKRYFVIGSAPQAHDLCRQIEHAPLVGTGSHSDAGSIGHNLYCSGTKSESHPGSLPVQTNFSFRAATALMRSSNSPWRKREMLVVP